MKRTLVALAATLIAAGGVLPVSAGAEETTSTTTGIFAGSGQESGSSTEGAVALAVSSAVVGGGAVWAVQQGLLPNPLPGLIPGPGQHTPAPAPRTGDCSPQAFNDARWGWAGSPRTRVHYCDGRFAWVYQAQTDWRLAFEFDGSRWNRLPMAGTTRTGMLQGCYNGQELRGKGAPEAFISPLPICTPDEIGYFPW